MKTSGSRNGPRSRPTRNATCWSSGPERRRFRRLRGRSLGLESHRPRRDHRRSDDSEDYSAPRDRARRLLSLSNQGGRGRRRPEPITKARSRRGTGSKRSVATSGSTPTAHTSVVWCNGTRLRRAGTAPATDRNSNPADRSSMARQSGRWPTSKAKRGATPARPRFLAKSLFQ